MDNNKNIRFVAERYRRGAFSTSRALRRIGLKSVSRSPKRVAAAVAAAVVLTTAAAVMIHNFWTVPVKDEATVVNVTEIETIDRTSLSVERVIEFDNITLSEVIEKIDEVYGVKVKGMPENADTCRLTLRYEGTAPDLVSTINEILDIELCVEE